MTTRIGLLPRESGCCMIYFFEDCKEALVDFIGDNIEVIGNVYQNKELLDKEILMII